MNSLGLTLKGNFYGLQWGKNFTYQKTAAGHEYWQGGGNSIASYDSLFKHGYTEKELMKLFLNVPEIFAPIHEIASRVMIGKYTLVNDKGEAVENNKLWNKLGKNPNWQETFNEMLYMAIVYKYVTGNRYFYRNIPATLSIKSQNISAAWVLPSQYIEIKEKQSKPKLFTTTSAADLIEKYIYDDEADKQEFSNDVVYHDKYLSLDDERFDECRKGVSPLAACEYNITNLVATYAARGIIFIKHGALGFFVSKAGDASGMVALTPGEKEEVNQDFSNTYGITGGKSPIGITRQPLEFIRTGLSIKDLEPFKETAADASTIYTVLGVPTELMPAMERNNLDSLKNAERSLYQNKVINEAEELANILTQWWGFADLGLKIKSSFDHISVLQENKKEMAEVDAKNQDTYLGRFTCGQMTLNDWRAIIGKEPVKNKLYDKLVFDMTPDELATVQNILSMNKKVSYGNNQAQSGQGVTTGTQGN